MKRRFLGRPIRTLAPADEIFFRWYRGPPLLPPLSSCEINEMRSVVGATCIKY